MPGACGTYLHIIWDIASIHSCSCCTHSTLQLVGQVIQHLKVLSAFQCAASCIESPPRIESPPYTPSTPAMYSSANRLCTRSVG